MRKVAKCFAHEKGAIFGFSNQADDDTGSVPKISSLDNDEIDDLNNVQTPNIGEEKSVVFFNYEIGIRAKINVEAASR